PIDVGAPLNLLRAGEGWQEATPPFPGESATGRRSGPDHHLGVEHLVECIVNDREPVLSVDHALHVVEIIEKAALSAATGQRQAVISTFAAPVTATA
ncbi:MAG TPA: hypothetical protein VNK95_08680, partial [Caldilineaceae bacterium]|nr:hypothetical protein [Caldilineaceae bacterium]